MKLSVRPGHAFARLRIEKKRSDLLQHFEALRRSEFDQDGSLGSRGVEAVRGDAVAQAIVDVLDVRLPVKADVSDLPPPNLK